MFDYPRLRYRRRSILLRFIEANSNLLILVSFCLVIIASIAIVFLLLQLRYLKRPFRAMAKIYEHDGADRALEELLKGVDENRELIREHAEELKVILKRLDGCYSGVGIEKYNAFEDIGGMQSYSLCMLTKERNGLLLTNLVGRNSARGYAIEVRAGKPSRELSDEERTAFECALKSLDA
jgi:hypothetical protein